MAHLLKRVAVSLPRTYTIHSRKHADKLCIGTMEALTGIQKKELEVSLAGDCDPWNLRYRKRGPGTRCEPIMIPSAYCSRIIGCHCYEGMNSISWMWLHFDEPKRCYCGYWFMMCPVEPFTE